jgi:hypothetical protein
MNSRRIVRTVAMGAALAAVATLPSPAQAEAAGGCFWQCMKTFGPVVSHHGHRHLYDGCMNIDGMILCFY